VKVVPALTAGCYRATEPAMEVKNLEPPGQDPRGTFGMSLASATADRGGCHRRSYVKADEILGGVVGSRIKR